MHEQYEALSQESLDKLDVKPTGKHTFSMNVDHELMRKISMIASHKRVTQKRLICAIVEPIVEHEYQRILEKERMILVGE